MVYYLLYITMLFTMNPHDVWAGVKYNTTDVPNLYVYWHTHNNNNNNNNIDMINTHINLQQNIQHLPSLGLIINNNLDIH